MSDPTNDKNVPDEAVTNDAPGTDVARVDAIPIEVTPVEHEREPVPTTTGSVYADFPEQNENLTAEPEAAAPKRQPTLRGAAVVGARVAVGIVGAVVAVVVVAGAGLISLPDITAKAAGVVVTPVATAQQLVCPGGLLRLSNDSGQGATTASALGAPALSFGASAGTVNIAAFSGSDAATGGTPSAPQLISTPPVTDGSTAPVLIGAAQQQTVATGEFVGLASASCTASSGDIWLSGGSTATGRTTLLTISNPSEVTATVNLEILTEKGPVTAPGMTGILIAPQGQRVLSLAGFAPGAESPVVHITSRGGKVVANLQQSIVRGLEAGGVDIVGQTQGASLTNVIPGVVVAGAGTIGQRSGREGYEDLETVLRLYVPGTVAAKAEVTVVPESGTTTGTSFELDVEAGKVTDFPIDELADGDYSISVTTTVPAVASARVSNAGSVAHGSKTDFAWLAAAPLLTSDAMVTTVAALVDDLHFTNPTSADQTVVINTPSGKTRPVPVPAGASVTIAVPANASYRINGYTGIYASVTARNDGGASGYTISAPGRESTPIRVYP
ncbi:DUF5719 family protein [Glaciihabitans sp. dw_435]|uniref:DUF5719 family protein n=1 Tax=Glaciihabitans sp. dw_435 TaxID=2720081 RepID=UPI001BD2B2D7|nr:DUF5719 family protein [Glaciihabitans sp. dw_435]